MSRIDIKRKRIYRFGENNAQGVAHAYDNIWFFASEKRILKYKIHGTLWQPSARPEEIAAVSLADIALPATRAGRRMVKQPMANRGQQMIWPQPVPEAYDHIGDISYHDGLLFVPVRDTAHNIAHDALLVLDKTFRLVGFSFLHQTTEAWCAINPGNGLLYLGDRKFPYVLRAFDVSTFYELLSAGSKTDWPQLCLLTPKPKGDIVLKQTDSSPETIHSIQGACFSPEGNLWITHYYTSKYLFGFTEWHNFLRQYNAVTGQIIKMTNEINFDGIGDEIEGVSLSPEGTLCVVVAVNSSGGDKFDIYAFDIPHAATLIGGSGGISGADRSTVTQRK